MGPSGGRGKSVALQTGDKGGSHKKKGVKAPKPPAHILKSEGGGGNSHREPRL